jgi:hypothetical protein
MAENTDDTGLFPIETVAMDSPRMKWMKRYDIHTEYHLLAQYWSAFICDDDGNPDYPPGGGNTEDDALAALAKRHGLRLWNEEDI